MIRLCFWATIAWLLSRYKTETPECPLSPGTRQWPPGVVSAAITRFSPRSPLPATCFGSLWASRHTRPQHRPPRDGCVLCARDCHPRPGRYRWGYCPGGRASEAVGRSGRAAGRRGLQFHNEKRRAKRRLARSTLAGAGIASIPPSGDLLRPVEFASDFSADGGGGIPMHGDPAGCRLFVGAIMAMNCAMVRRIGAVLPVALSISAVIRSSLTIPSIVLVSDC